MDFYFATNIIIIGIMLNLSFQCGAYMTHSITMDFILGIRNFTIIPL